MSTKEFTYKYHDQFIFRTPLLPLPKKEIDRIEFKNYTSDPTFKEAIYLASPVLFTELLKWHKGQIKEEKEIEKLIISLYKYYSRMQIRCTPYGLFAACGTGEWNNRSELIISESVKRHTRLDMNYVCSLAQQLNNHSTIRPLLRFFPNNSIYAFGEQLRYVEYRYVNNKRIHRISSVDNSEYLQKILNHCHKGSCINDLANLLVDDDITYDDSESFIKELIDSQIIVSELEPAVTGDEFIYQIINTLKLINKESSTEINAIIELLISTQEQISIIDNEIGNEVISYKNIYENLQVIGVAIEENQLFQVDMYRSTNVSILDISIQSQLTEAISFLNRMNRNYENTNLKIFRENFYKQYEDAELPLLEVLDTETGIGYKGKDILGINTLLNDIYIPNKIQESYDIKWNELQKFLQKYLQKAIKDDAYCVVFTDDDIKNFTSISHSMPNTLAVMFRIVNESNKLYLLESGGATAANLLGRFAHGDESIYNIVKDITSHEATYDDDKILAEIVHLPENRIGNILLRPVLRDYEIPYLGKSALPSDNQILLQDIMVSIQGNRIILRSKKLNKEIAPRLSTAHNYSYNALPVYQFLCDVQMQNIEKAGFSFGWGVLSKEYKFLPRAEYKNVILHRAKWQFLKEDYKIFTDKNKTPVKKDIVEWRNRWNIPTLVLLIDADNELMINFEDDLSVQMFINTIKKQEQIILEEFLFDVNNSFVKDSIGNSYTNEFIAILLKDEKFKNNSPFNYKKLLNNGINVKRDFNIGSEWLYYKFYCGVKTCDKFLTDIVKPLVDELILKKWIDKFFFIRYYDPDLHIRLRFHINDIEKIGIVIQTIDKFVQSYINQGLINKIQIETYKRELVRYGHNTIIIAESFFYIDSICALHLLNLIEGEEGEQFRWQFAIRSMDELLNNFKYTINDKLKLLEILKTNFVNEHGNHKELKLQLDNKFRNTRKQVENILNTDLDNESETVSILNIFKWKSDQIAPLASEIIYLKNNRQLEVDLEDLLSSYIHMMLNRIFKSRQRTYEMVMYYSLYNYYKSKIAREKNKNSPLKKIEV